MIPYTVERRADTGVNNVTLGIWLFLASEVMLFGALFSSYALLRVSALQWPHGRDLLNLTLGAANTAVLLVMGALAWRAGRTGRHGMGAKSGQAANGYDANVSVHRARQLLAVSSIFAVVFLVVKVIEWRGEIARGLVPSVNTFLAMYFTLTGLHALHVACGLVANAWAIAGGRRVGDAMTLGRIRAVSLYWAFVDAVWLMIFVLMYLT